MEGVTFQLNTAAATIIKQNSFIQHLLQNAQQMSQTPTQ